MLIKLPKMKKELYLRLIGLLLIYITCKDIWGMEEDSNCFLEYSLNDSYVNEYNDLECDNNYYDNDEMKDDLIRVRDVFFYTNKNINVLM